MSNYEKLLEDWRQRFLQMDARALLRRLPELHDEGTYLTISHFGRRFGISRASGEIVCTDGGTATQTEKLNIYTLLYYGKPEAALRGEWVSFGNLRGAAPFAPAFRAGVQASFARTFAGQEALLRKAAADLGARPLPSTGTAFEADAFACIPVRFYFWEGDEEFPAQANFLFDAGTPDFIHVESVVTIASAGLTRLAELAGLRENEASF